MAIGGINDIIVGCRGSNDLCNGHDYGRVRLQKEGR